MKKKAKKTEPVMIKAMSFGDMLDDIANQPAPKPMSKKDQDEVNELLRQLAASQGPGDAFLMINVPRSKPKSK